MSLVPAIPTDRLRGAFLAMVKAVAPNLIYAATYEYRVISSSAPGGTQSTLGGVTWVVSAIPADPVIVKLLPPVANITMWPGPVWGYSVPAVGSLVRVAFVNMDPSKPAIVGLDPTLPATSVTLGSVLATFVTLAPALATAISTASAAAAAAAVPGDGGKAAFSAFAGSMATSASGYTAKIVKAT